VFGWVLSRRAAIHRSCRSNVSFMVAAWQS
jgi:hypothetical protein